MSSAAGPLEWALCLLVGWWALVDAGVLVGAAPAPVEEATLLAGAAALGATAAALVGAVDVRLRAGCGAVVEAAELAVGAVLVGAGPSCAVAAGASPDAPTPFSAPPPSDRKMRTKSQGMVHWDSPVWGITEEGRHTTQRWFKRRQCHKTSPSHT